MFLKSLNIFLLLIADVALHTVQVKVEQGTVIGIRLSTVFEKKLYYAFYGVPYAQPPVGELRFKDPKPAKKWETPFDASLEYHGACSQAHIVHKQGLYGFENCLNMNIYTPHLPKDGNNNLKPVIVWIHGYAFTSSFSHIHGADFIINNDVLFVSVTHRIGVFGFLKKNETDTHANMGLKDIVRALQWIRRNIKKFGGDHNQITVMGNGSASTFLSILLMTKFKKLFSKMILHSGALYSPSLFQTDHILERDRLLKALKKITLDDLDTAETKDIILASANIYTSKELINFQRPIIPFMPTLEEKSKMALVTNDPLKENLKHNTPILIGFNSQESISEAIPFIHNPRFLKSFEAFFKFMVPFTGKCRYNYTSKKYTEISDKIKNKYFAGSITEHSLDNFLRYVSDLLIYPILQFINTSLNKKKDNMYVYKFNYVGNFSAVKRNSLANANVRVKGAAAGDEICYVLKCEPLWEDYVRIIPDANNKDRKLIAEMANLWSNFANYGNFFVA
uniref:Carboxylesterase n=1 Tax=Plodia interpunctella TaxID=58824 RepID=A0A5B8R4P3_PLOIN|nr:carboxylesterase [Plodia interpunctella]